MNNTQEYDCCIVGSGAGAGPVAYELSKAGYKVVILEKGKWYKEKDFRKDDLLSRHSVFRSKFSEERHVLEEPDGEGWSSDTTSEFWGGNIVGGASNFMSAYFHRLKPEDYRLLSTFGPIDGANQVDWPIRYDDMEPYYRKVEEIVGVSGKIVEHPFLEPRSTPDYPFPPTNEHPISSWFDKTCNQMGLHPLPMARGVLSKPFNGRASCQYSGYCGSYGCASGAKASSRASLLDQAMTTGNLEIKTESKVYRLNSNSQGNVESVEFYDKHKQSQQIRAKIFVVACYSIESARLLLSSPGEKHPDGLGNRYQQIGKNLHCCAGGTGHGLFEFSDFTPQQADQVESPGTFFNQSVAGLVFYRRQASLR
ncbi:MAG: GMC family oxidoreductase [Enterobacterales bacterium]|nr:GMC family oxidoreductase [Enterobacterales bacterium]